MVSTQHRVDFNPLNTYISLHIAPLSQFWDISLFLDFLGFPIFSLIFALIFAFGDAFEKRELAQQMKWLFYLTKGLKTAINYGAP